MPAYDTIESEDQAAQLIARYFPEAARRLARGNVEDFARIAVFLESKQRVLDELEQLEQLLVAELARRRAAAGAAIYERGGIVSPDDQKRLLTTVLDRWDQGFGFNSMVNYVPETDPIDFGAESMVVTARGRERAPATFAELKGVLPEGTTPQLSGFVAPPAFRRALLRLGYHWRDPGAGDVHGDMTHRIQWFAITSAYQANRLPLGTFPLYLFQKLASPVCWNERFKADGCPNVGARALWDLLCDCFHETLQQDPAGVGPYSAPGSYRSPVAMQADLTAKRVESRTQTFKDLLESRRLHVLRAILGRRRLRFTEKTAKAVEYAASAAAADGPTLTIAVDYEGPGKTHEMDGKIVFKGRA